MPGPSRGTVRPQQPPARRRAAGFVLVATLLILLGLSALAAGGLLLAGAEAAAARSHAGSVRAYLAAGGALSGFLGEEQGSPPADPFIAAAAPAARTKTRLEARRLLVLDPARELWQVNVLGTYGSGRDLARSTLSAVVLVRPVPARLPAALTAAGGLEIEDPAARIDGRDSASADPACAGLHGGDVAGAATPPGAYHQSDPSTLQATGSPDTLTVDPAVLFQASGVHWTDILDRTGAFDARLPVDPWPAPGAGWPAILAGGESLQADASRSGRGLLVVEGDLTLRDGFRWEGVILVGGRIVTEGAVSVTGGAMAGLSGGDASGSSGPSLLGTGPAEFRYDACASARAGRALAVRVLVPGTWSEAFTPWSP